MGDGLKLVKDKRHRSSSSLTGTLIEGSRSERRLEIRASIPEVDDQFALAEARCDDLQEKIDLVKVQKRKKKLKKRSMTRMTESPANENVPFITVRTQPKKTLIASPADSLIPPPKQRQPHYSKQLDNITTSTTLSLKKTLDLLVTEVPAERRRLERRSYLDHATLEQHRMLGQVFRGPNAGRQPVKEKPNRRMQRSRADGDALIEIAERSVENASHEVACGDDAQEEYDTGFDVRFTDNLSGITSRAKITNNLVKTKSPNTRRRHVPKETGAATGGGGTEKEQERRDQNQTKIRIRHSTNKQLNNNGTNLKQTEERPVVELFNHNRAIRSPEPRLPQRGTSLKNNKQAQRERNEDNEEEEATGNLEANTILKERERHPRRVRYRTRRYEMPTVSSQMKQNVARVPITSALPPHNIPFVVSKSTEPSHNVGVNLQQVLNGMKIQQPLSNIPLSIAHQMGLGHIPTYGARSFTRRPAISGGCMNAIWLSGRVLRVPSRRCVSYGRLLAMYREGEGIVPRFLRAIARPHYFYTSMYNLPTHREDFDGATSKGRGDSQEAKQSLAEYASLYREFERVEKSLAVSYDPELERRRDELARLLASREEHIRKVVQDYRTAAEEGTTLRASASTAEETYRHSSFRLNDNMHQ